MQIRLSQPLQLDVCPEEFEVEFPLHWFSYLQKGNDLNHLHIHNGVEIGLCISGSGIFAIGSRLYPFTKGDVSVAFANQPHIAHSPDGSPSRWLFLNVNLQAMGIGSNERNVALPGIFPKYIYPNLSALIQMIFDELQEEKPEYQQMIRILLQAWQTALDRECSSLSSYKSLGEGSNSDLAAILPALNLMTIGYGKPLTVSELAELCHFSISHFRRSFKQITGISPWDYLTEVRMRMAWSLLTGTKKAVTAISQEVGYNSISSFHRHFQKAYQITPLACRQHKTQ